MQDFNLSSFLEEQASGGQSQGVGDFTISHEKAAKKMAEYSLPREHAWVLKLIQAGVGWGCDEIRVTQSQLFSTFHFKFSDFSALPTNNQLVSAILRADLESTKPLDAFAMGLRLVVEKSHLSFLLLIDTDDIAPQAIYAGVYFGEMDEKRRAEMRVGWGKGVTVMLHHIAHSDSNRLLLNFIPIARHGLPMFLELDRYAFACPVPITLDGRRVDGLFRSGRFGWSSEFKPLRTCGVEVPGDLDPAFGISPGFDDHTFSVFTPRRELSRLTRPNRAEVFLALCVRSQKSCDSLEQKVEPSTLFWVRDGVVVDMEPLPGKTTFLRLYVFANAEGLRSDLTGFQLIRDDALNQRAERILVQIGDALKLEYGAERDLMERPPTVATMKGEQLASLSLPSRTLTKGLQGRNPKKMRPDLVAPEPPGMKLA